MPSPHVTFRGDAIVLTGARVELTATGQADTLQVEAQGSLVASRSGSSAFYKAELKNLIPGNTYFYRLVNDTLRSAWHAFHVPAADSTLSFLYIGDIQDQTDGNTREVFPGIPKRYPEVDFWAFVGDVIERPTDIYWNYWYSTMDSIIPGYPVIAATGNHEYLKGLIKQLDPRWIHSFRFPENGPEDSKGRSYFVNYEDVCFIVLDTDGIQGAGSLWQHYFWLKEVLSTTDKKWKIIMMHHPVYSVRDSRINPGIRYVINPLIEKYGVQLVLQGHDHGYSRIAAKDDKGETICPVYIVSSLSPKHYAIGFNERHDRLGSGLSLYQHITVTGDSLHYQSFTVGEHELYDDLLIVSEGQTCRVRDNAKNIPEKLALPPSQARKVNIEKYDQKVKERESYKKTLRSRP